MRTAAATSEKNSTRKKRRNGYPENARGRQVCMVVTGKGIKIYGNKAAFRSLAKWMAWIARSKPEEHYECHLGWHFRVPDHDAGRPTVYTIVDKRMTEALSLLRQRQPEFDVTFMAVEEADLDRLLSTKGIRKEGGRGPMLLRNS